MAQSVPGKLSPVVRERGAAFTLIELIASVAIVSVLAVTILLAGRKALQESSLAISANNLRQLSVGGMAYLGDHNQTFWKYVDISSQGYTWWFGYESNTSRALPEGQRSFDGELGPLGGYIPAGVKPDPSFNIGGNAFKPKYKFGYLGIGYNVLLGGSWGGTSTLAKVTAMNQPGQVVVFFTSAQVNNFQAPASAANPMLEEFYGIDNREVTVHFRHHGYAMVIYANGSAGFLPMDPTTRDQRMPKADVGRFAPVGSTLYLQ